MRRFLVIIAVAVLTLATAGGAAAAERVALLIGNGDYAHTSRLQNPTNDVAAMRQSLERLGYEVSTVEDAGRSDMARALRDFGQKARGAETALFFYSGHGMEIAGKNYLIPVDAELGHPDDAEFEAITLDSVVNSSSNASKLSMVIVDACRNNTFPSTSRSGARGLARMEARAGQAIAFSTAPGEVALDGSGNISPYTRALTEALAERADTDVRILFTSLGEATSRYAGVDQRPFARFGDMPASAVSLATPSATSSAPPPAPAPAAGSTDLEWEPRLADYRAAQETLKALGYYRSTIDGFWGPGSARALIAFQTDRGLAASDGALTQDAIAALAEAVAGGAENRGAGPAPLSTIKDCDACPEVIVLPGGSYRMGSPPNEPDRQLDEGPIHTVSVKPFAMGRTEVTVAQWAAYLRATGRRYADGCRTERGGKFADDPDASWRSPGFSQGDDHPVVCVSQGDAKSYVNWLNQEVGVAGLYRLPSEAEWEYATRAGTVTAFAFGDALRPGEAMFGHKATSRSAAGEANAWGLYGVHGNAWEWTADCWNARYRGAPEDGSAWTDGDCAQAPLRGGSWFDQAKTLRSANRIKLKPGHRSSDVGFRIARELR